MAKRCLSVNAPTMAAAADPIQVKLWSNLNIFLSSLHIKDLFVEKIRDYSSKKVAAKGEMVDATEATKLDLQNELDKVAKAYGGGAGVDMTAFPELKFEELTLDSINISQWKCVIYFKEWS